MGLSDAYNSYGYGTNPIGFVDPWGLEAIAFKTIGNTLCIKNKFPAGSAESKELKEFTGRWNNQIKDNGGSMTRRVLTDQEKRILRLGNERHAKIARVAKLLDMSLMLLLVGRQCRKTGCSKCQLQTVMSVALCRNCQSAIHIAA